MRGKDQNVLCFSWLLHSKPFSLLFYATDFLSTAAVVGFMRGNNTCFLSNLLEILCHRVEFSCITYLISLEREI